MRIAVCTNLINGIGLEREWCLLRDHLIELGHEVSGLQYDEPLPKDFQPCDLMISIETVSRHLLSCAPIHWLFPNPEWFAQDLIPIVKRHYDKILTKTHEAQRIFEPLFPGKTFYTGFLARDQMDARIPRERKFLHVGGNSSLRNTQAVIDAWKWEKEGRGLNAPLTIISQKLKTQEVPPNVTVLERVSEEELRQLQNSHLFHLYPSGTEGFGHALREALSVNATILTVGKPPMSEIPGLYFVPSETSTFFGLAEVHEVDARDIFKFVDCSGYWNLDELAACMSTRQQFLKGNAQFRAHFGKHLAQQACAHHPAPQAPAINRERLHREFVGQKRVAFLGNFAHSFCTEADLAWSLEHLGHEVSRVQEDRATLSELQASVFDADMFMWVHTHGWDTVGDEEMLEFLHFLEEKGIPSVFVHLDRYWGIPEREELIGISPCWKCDYIFTADGGNDERFAARGVKHFWMPPAVVERGVHFGFPRGDLRCDVAFVGAGAGYHPCYPFRAELLGFLQSRYGGRFKHFQGVRESQLNDVYASAKVVVGDSIFAGALAPKYWSDRLPETIGRGGFLIYPRIEGMTIPCATYVPQSVGDLEEQIGYWLDMPASRREMVNVGMDHVRQNDTYTNRVEQILKTVSKVRIWQR
jgi:glycosyltransferase involved in cell wall biosynthesis